MADAFFHAYNFSAISASANIYGAPGYLGGIFVASASNTPSIAIYDDPATGTSTPLVAVFTPAAAAWYWLPFKFNTGLYVVIGGTVSCTVGYLKGYPFTKGS